jgi:hypothetical protein
MGRNRGQFRETPGERQGCGGEWKHRTSNIERRTLKERRAPARQVARRNSLANRRRLSPKWVVEKEAKEENQKENDLSHNALILFPEIIGVSLMAIIMPFLLVKMLRAGHLLASVAGFLVWGIALFIAVSCIRRRQYALAYLPMIVIFGLYFLVWKALHP